MLHERFSQDMKLIQTMMGHSRIGTTYDLYVTQNPEKLRAAMTDLDERLSSHVSYAS